MILSSDDYPWRSHFPESVQLNIVVSEFLTGCLSLALKKWSCEVWSCRSVALASGKHQSRSYCTRFAFCLLLPFAAAGNDSVCFLFRSWETARWQSLSAPQTLKSSVKGERFIPAVWRAWVVSLGFSLSNLWFLHLLWKWIKEVLAWTY